MSYTTRIEELLEDLSVFDDWTDRYEFIISQGRHLPPLPEKYRTVLYLFYYEDYSVREIARIMHVKDSAVTTRLSRAREQLKESLTKEDAYGL